MDSEVVFMVVPDVPDVLDVPDIEMFQNEGHFMKMKWTSDFISVFTWP
jgi:hypothetical protein